MGTNNVIINELRQNLGLPGNLTKRDTLICNTKLSQDTIVRIEPSEYYYLYFLLTGNIHVSYQERQFIFLENQMLLLSGKEPAILKVDHDSALVTIRFKEIGNPENILYLNNLYPLFNSQKDSPVTAFPTPESIRQFIRETSIELNSEETLLPQTQDLLFLLLRANFAPKEMAILFHDLIDDQLKENKEINTIN